MSGERDAVVTAALTLGMGADIIRGWLDAMVRVDTPERRIEAFAAIREVLEDMDAAKELLQPVAERLA